MVRKIYLNKCILLLFYYLKLKFSDQVEVKTADETVSFFVIGDWGGIPVFPYRTLIENSVSKEMENLAQMHNTQFQLALGDNFYVTGVKDADDKRFKV